MATYNNGNSSNTYYVPSGVETIRIRAWGAGGGDGANGSNEDSSPGGNGGNGGFTRTYLSVSPGDQLEVYVGAGGQDGQSDYKGVGHDGPGGNSPLQSGANGGMHPVNWNYDDNHGNGAGGGGGGGGLTGVDGPNGNPVVRSGGGAGGGGGGAQDGNGSDAGGAGGGAGGGGGSGGAGSSGENDGEGEYDMSGQPGGSRGTPASGQNVGANGGDGTNNWYDGQGGPGGNGGGHVFQGYSNNVNNGGGNGGAGKVIIDEGPTTPTNFSAVSNGTDVDLSWDDSNYENGYKIHRSTTQGFSTSSSNRIASLGSGSTSYTDTTATAGNTYYYIVRAHNGIGSNESTEESAFPAFMLSIYQDTQWINGMVYVYDGSNWISPSNIQTYQSGSWQDY